MRYSKIVSAYVDCCLCDESVSTANLRTGYAGYCKRCNVYWHSNCHVISQCPQCDRYTEYGQGGLCVVSSACAAAKGLPDDCSELQALRRLRDDHLLTTREGAFLVANYYRRAPAVVAAIDARGDALGVYAAIFTNMVEPCAQLVLAGCTVEAIALYRSRFSELEAMLAIPRVWRGAHR